MHIKENLIQQLINLGIEPNDTIMVHASLRAIGKVLGGPDQVLLAIIEAIAPHGTLMMYVGCEPEYEAVGRGNISTEEEQHILQYCPAFDPTTARARCDYGALAEFFRSLPGVICSTNPGARMAAMGSKANWLLAEHPLQYGYGPDSPLASFYEASGKVLLLGSDLDQVTLLHYAEHIAPITEKRVVRFKVPLLQNDQRQWRDVEEYDTGMGIRQWPERFFAEIVKNYLNTYKINVGKVGNADSLLLDARQLVDFAIPIFVEAANIHSC
ncbi:aminoglycoside 3-N-acetyltransferase [soil metagenome]